jgi:adenine phosphoribosyltransferase
MNERQLKIKSYIKDIPDFPQKGIIFRDITSLFKNTLGFNLVSNELYNVFVNEDLNFNKVVGIEARGFILGTLMADIAGKSLILARKPGKLPNETLQKKYSLEYGESSMCIQLCDIQKGDNVVVIDDVLATSNTAVTVCQIIETLGGRVEACYFLIELDYLKGREKIENLGIKVISSIHY